MNFTIPSSEGLPIRGDFDVPAHAARALVVIVHGFKGFKDWGFFPWLAQQLCRDRIAVCRFNMSRSGIGQDPESFDRLDLFADDTYSQQVRDLRTVIQYAQDSFRGLPTFLLGHSRGGGVSLLTASGVEGLRGVITWSAIARADRWDDATRKQWRENGRFDVLNQRTKQVMSMSPAILDDYDAHRSDLDILGATDRLNLPLLVIHGAKDENVPLSEAREIAGRGADRSLLVIESASHTYNAIHPLVHIPAALTFAAQVSSRFITTYAYRYDVGR